MPLKANIPIGNTGIISSITRITRISADYLTGKTEIGYGFYLDENSIERIIGQTIIVDAVPDSEPQAWAEQQLIASTVQETGPDNTTHDIPGPWEAASSVTAPLPDPATPKSPAIPTPVPPTA